MFGGKKKTAEEEWDETFEPLMKVLLGKKGLKTKSASEGNKKKVDYFRGKDFKKFLLENENVLKKKCSAALNEVLEGNPPTTQADVERLGAELLARGTKDGRRFCYKAVYKPINQQKADGEKPKEKKWPDRLEKTGINPHSFQCEGFYVVNYEGGSGLQHFLLALIIAGVLLACMFPVWPMWAKIGIWYLSVIFLSFYFGILILRLLIFTMFWIVGFDFWIFPNLNDEYCGFLETFQPLYSWEKRKDDALTLLVRFASLAITAVAVQQIAETHSLADVQDFVVASYVDVLDWGVDKLAGALPSAERQALPNLGDLEKEAAADANQTKGDFKTAAEVMTDLNADENDEDDGADTVKVDN